MWVARAFEVGFYTHSSFANGEALTGTPGSWCPRTLDFCGISWSKAGLEVPGRGVARLAASQPWVEGSLPWGWGSGRYVGVWMIVQRWSLDGGGEVLDGRWKEIERPKVTLRYTSNITRCRRLNESERHCDFSWQCAETVAIDLARGLIRNSCNHSHKLGRVLSSNRERGWDACGFS